MAAPRKFDAENRARTVRMYQDQIRRDESTYRCYRIELTIPTDADLASGTYLLPGGLGGLSTRLTSPIQYAAGEIARLRDYGRSGIGL